MSEELISDSDTDDFLDLVKSADDSLARKRRKARRNPVAEAAYEDDDGLKPPTNKLMSMAVFW